jgi:transposase InsO family protein
MAASHHARASTSDIGQIPSWATVVPPRREIEAAQEARWGQDAVASPRPQVGERRPDACQDNGIEHRTTKVKHPWTNGQVERMNRTIKEATVRRFHYDSHDQLHSHLADFIAAYNFGRRLKTLKGLSPVEFICKQWTIEPQRFSLNPIHQMPGLNN